MPRTPPVPILPLIDGDILLWRAACGAQHNICFDADTCLPVCSLADAEAAVDAMLSAILRDLKADDFLFCLSDPERNFRKEICPTYKANRANKPRPVALTPLRASVTGGRLFPPERLVSVPRLEADDVLGILSTHPGYGRDRRKVIVSIDKDFQSIPGLFYNFSTKARQRISAEQADLWHLRQPLIGDPADLWPVVVAAYEQAGLTGADALIQARLARILRAADYDFAAKEVRPWMSPARPTPATTANTA